MGNKVESRLLELGLRETKLELLLSQGQHTGGDMKELKRQLLDIRVRKRNLTRSNHRQKKGPHENISNNVVEPKLTEMKPKEDLREDLNNNLPPGEHKLSILPVYSGILSKSEKDEIFQGRRIVSHKDSSLNSEAMLTADQNISSMLTAKAVDLPPSSPVMETTEDSDIPTSTRPKLKLAIVKSLTAEPSVTKVSTEETPSSSCVADILVQEDNIRTSGDIVKENTAETGVLTSIRPKLKSHRVSSQCPNLLFSSSSACDKISKTLTVVQPSGLVRFLLGSGGRGLEAIEKESDAKISVTGRFGDEINNLKIIGTKEAVKKAEELMMNSEKVSLTRRQAGLMLRNGGKTLKRIENDSKAIVTIEGGKKDSKRNTCISGTEEAKRKAKALIMEALRGM